MAKHSKSSQRAAKFLAALAWVAITGEASCALSPKHSKDFPLRYECDVAPGLADWTLTPVSTGAAVQASNGWLSFTTSLSQVTAYRNSQWSVAANQAYTMEIRVRTPRRGRMILEVDDGSVFRDTLSISSTGLLWNVNGVTAWISANTSNAMHVVRLAAWSEEGQHMIQIWQDGRSVYGPTTNSTPSPLTGAATTWGEPSVAEECALEIDYLRMVVGAAYVPFTPQMSIARGAGAVVVTWPMARRALYQLQAAPDLTGGEWGNIGAKVPATTAGNHFISETTVGQNARFYRVGEIIEGAFVQTWSPGPAPICTGLPAFNCTANCLDLVPFDPVLGPGYDNYPINGETAADQYRSFVRREVRQAIQHAAARVECQAGHWPFGNNRPVGLGDMSEANGSIPGTREGSPSHPVGTHQNGTDIDIAYYQLDTTNSHVRSICESRVNGVDQFHCVAPPNRLDVWRTALFVGILMDHPRLRVIGVDGQVGPLLVQAIAQLAAAGWLSPTAPTTAQQKLAFETSDGGLGWYYFHHQYMHISFRNQLLTE